MSTDPCVFLASFILTKIGNQPACDELKINKIFKENASIHTEILFGNSRMGSCYLQQSAWM